MEKKFLLIIVISSLFLLLNACQANQEDSGDPEYEARLITLEGLSEGEQSISVAQLRLLTQQDLQASYQRTTGKTERFKMQGPSLMDVVAFLGGDLRNYTGVGVEGADGYYCLLSQEILENYEPILALSIDGKKKLSASDAPARLAVQGQFGPYWVRMVEKITFYQDVPEKNITSVWLFANLAAGLEPYDYKYYGSTDKSYELAEIFNRLEKVDSKSFFTMKSADGFKKNEAIAMVKERYYLKTEGADSPTNVSPYIKLGMNVKNMAWFSASNDACIFPEQMQNYLPRHQFQEVKGLRLLDILLETEVITPQQKDFVLIGMSGEEVKVKGSDLAHALLVIQENGEYAVIWDDDYKIDNIGNLLRIKEIS
ncbi:MAG: hypothetical protein FWF85_04820 [Clostridiales bacterium]|nr:hypothetical protein [Clostridiales bacterium]